MLGLIYRFVQNSALARWIASVLMGFAVVQAYVAVKKREAVAMERMRKAQRDAQANEEAHDRINEADTGAGLDDDQRRERLRDFAAKHGTGSPKAGGR